MLTQAPEVQPLEEPLNHVEQSIAANDNPSDESVSPGLTSQVAGIAGKVFEQSG